MTRRDRWSMLGLFLLPIVLRLGLMPFHGVPIPTGGDDFSFLLQADTFTHFRLANAVHSMHRFFETDFILQEPSYSSIYPPGQGLFLAAGQIVAGSPWAGVLLACGLLCSLAYWALRARLSEKWSLIGGLLAITMYGPLSSWTNSYWGGHVAGIAGCLIFGAMVRQSAIFLGVGLGLAAMTRPFEALLLVPLVALYLPRKTLVIATFAALPFLLFIGLHNRAVTGSWTKLPYLESREQYGVPTTFTFQSAPTPQRELTREQRMDYQAQTLVHDAAGDYFTRLAWRLSAYRFFFLLPLLPALFLCRDWRMWLPVVVVAFGTNFYPYFYPHYLALLLPIFLAITVTGLSNAPPKLSLAMLTFAFGQFVFWYGVHLWRDPELLARLEQYESPNYIGWGDAEGRRAIRTQLEQTDGTHLVFVHYGPRHSFHEWVANEADIDASRIVWARDRSPLENELLRRYYASRRAWVLAPDNYPPRLEPYQPPQEEQHFEGVTSLPLSGFIRH